MKRLAIVALSAAISSFSARAFAQGNHQSYPLGERATGLGGAYTALADDAAGAFYNPAGPAFSVGNSVSVSSSLYGLVGASYPGGLGTGLDYDYASLNLLPSSVGTLLRFGPRRSDGSARFTLAGNLFTPNLYQVDRRVSARHNQTVLFVSNNERTILVGPSLAWRVNDWIALGASIFGALHLHYDRLDLSDQRPGMARNTFVQFSSSLESISVGALGALGIRLDLRPGLSVGASFRSPAVQIHGQGDVFRRTLFLLETGPTVQTLLGSAQTTRILPGRITAGIAWVLRDRFALTADLAVYLPVRFDAVRFTTAPAANEVHDFRGIANGALGIEWQFHRRLIARAGAFTDLSAAPDPSSGVSRIDRVQQVGATLTGTMLFGPTSSTVGVVATWGTASVIGTDIASGRYDEFVTQGTQWRVYLVYAGTARY